MSIPANININMQRKPASRSGRVLDFDGLFVLR